MLHHLEQAFADVLLWLRMHLIRLLCVVIPPCLRMVRQQKNGRKDYVPLLIASFNFEKGRRKRKGINEETDKIWQYYQELLFV